MCGYQTIISDLIDWIDRACPGSLNDLMTIQDPEGESSEDEDDDEDVGEDEDE